MNTKNDFNDIKELRKKIEDINWIKERIDIFYKRYLPVSLGYVGKHKKDEFCKIKYNYNKECNRLGEFNYYIVFGDSVSYDAIIIYLKAIQRYLLNDSDWRTFKDVMDILKTTVLHEYRHYLQIEKIYELDMLYLLDYNWVDDLLEEDAKIYAKAFVRKGKNINLDTIISKIILEDKINMNLRSMEYLNSREE